MIYGRTRDEIRIICQTVDCNLLCLYGRLCLFNNVRHHGKQSGIALNIRRKRQIIDTDRLNIGNHVNDNNKFFYNYKNQERILN